MRACVRVWRSGVTSDRARRPPLSFFSRRGRDERIVHSLPVLEKQNGSERGDGAGSGRAAVSHHGGGLQRRRQGARSHFDGGGGGGDGGGGGGGGDAAVSGRLELSRVACAAAASARRARPRAEVPRRLAHSLIYSRNSSLPPSLNMNLQLCRSSVLLFTPSLPYTESPDSEDTP
eukprot:5099853-Pleurochrysis_carterae.AAC.1